jgi:hypothetical protein
MDMMSGPTGLDIFFVALFFVVFWVVAFIVVFLPIIIIDVIAHKFNVRSV